MPTCRQCQDTWARVRVRARVRLRAATRLEVGVRGS